MQGYRNTYLITLGILATVLLAWRAMDTGTPTVGLEMLVLYMWGGITGSVFGRGYNKKQEKPA